MRGVGDQRVAFPCAGGEPGTRVQSIFGRVRPAVHPNGDRRPILPAADGIGDHVSFHRICFAPDLQTKRSLHQIKRRPSLALVFHHFQLRLGITQRSNPPFLAERDSREVYRQPVASKELMVSWRPGAGKLHLREAAAEPNRHRARSCVALFCGARSWIPFRSVGLLLELRTHGKRLAEVLRIVDDGGHQQHLATAWDRRDIEVFRNSRVLAVRHAILAQISGPQVSRRYLQRRWLFPLRTGKPLPCPLTLRRRRGIEMDSRVCMP